MRTERLMASAVNLAQPLALALLLVCLATPAVWAVSAVSAALGGAEVALPANGLPLNPAAVSITGKGMTLHVGVGFPADADTVGYVALYEPKDAVGVGAAVSGMLGAAQERRNPRNLNDHLVYDKLTTITYQLGEDIGQLGAVGAGVRLLQHEDGVTGERAQAWRLDVGWQYLHDRFIVGVAARDVAGSELRQGGVAAALSPAFYAGAAFAVTEKAWATVELADLRQDKPGTWQAGIAAEVMPMLTLRAGFSSAAGETSLTAGVGVRSGAWQIDATVRSSDAAQVTGAIGAALSF